MVGCAVLRELTVNHGWRCLLVEASAHLAAGASSGNTGIACTASDARPGTLEHACLTEGTRLNLPTYRQLNVPHRASGALYVGYDATELAALERERLMRMERGDATTAMLTAGEARALEPALDAGVAGALLVPGETVVDPWLVPIAYARHAHEHGATIRRSTEVRAAVFAGGSWKLTLASGLAGSQAHSDGTAHSAHEEPREPRVVVSQEESKVIVACGGLHGDRLEGLHRTPPFGIRPRRGDFVLFDESARLGKMPLGQVPTATSRGLYTWRSVHGVIACGPTAEEVSERATPPTATDGTVREALRAAAIRAVPSLRDATVTGTYAGLRPGSDVSADYVIEAAPTNPTWVTVGAIRSTGLTASLGIARHVGRLCEQAVRDRDACGLTGHAVRGRDLPAPRSSATLGRGCGSTAVESSDASTTTAQAGAVDGGAGGTPIQATPLPPVEALVESYRKRQDGYVDFGEDPLGCSFGAHYVTHPLTRAGLERRARLMQA